MVDKEDKKDTEDSIKDLEKIIDVVKEHSPSVLPQLEMECSAV